MNIWLQLGVAGGALFILYKFIVMLFSYLKERNEIEKKFGCKTNDSTLSAINRLCDNIDKLVEAFHGYTEKVNELAATNLKDNQIIKDTTDMQFTLLQDIKGTVLRVDERIAIIIDKVIKKEGV